MEVTDAFYARAREIWGPVAADWQRTLADTFTVAELTTIAGFLAQVDDLGARHAERVRELPAR